MKTGVTRTKLLFRVLLVVSVWSAAVHAADYADAVRAYDQGNYSLAAATLKPLAEAGNTKAQVRLGLMYRDGRGVARDSATAFGWLMRAARGGRADAQYLVGMMYRRGDGVAADQTASEAWLRRAAAHGNRKAIAALAGKSPAIESESESAPNAADSGSETQTTANGPAIAAETQAVLAAMDPPASAAEVAAINKANAHGIKINYGSLDAHAPAAHEEAKAEEVKPALTPAEAPTTLQQVMSHGSPQPSNSALESIAAGDASDEQSTTQLPERAQMPPQQITSVDQLERRAAAGNVVAQRQLAQSYLNGTGVARDPARAAHWLRRAAALGDAESQFILSGMYFKGEGVPRDRSVAVQWLRRAAAQGHRQAKAQLTQSGN